MSVLNCLVYRGDAKGPDRLVGDPGSRLTKLTDWCRGTRPLGASFSECESSWIWPGGELKKSGEVISIVVIVDHSCEMAVLSLFVSCKSTEGGNVADMDRESTKHHI